ncbi:cob(I)yrinic acid a,c-diamide adenosyltransferase [bacterium]|nr:cob(I)yrinic acid a,c-diamide adenosyltransferase [bacterium]
MIQVYTGNGKGKTTAALGLAFRACGHSKKVIMIQFMKGDIEYGEITASKKLDGFSIHQFGLPTFVKKGEPSPEDLRLAKAGFDFAKKTITETKHDIVILDEINVAIDYGLIELDDLLKLLNDVPSDMEIILTGRYANPAILERSDLVTEMREIKHPYIKGVAAREGIEF